MPHHLQGEPEGVQRAGHLRTERAPAVGADLPPDPASLSDEERAAIRKRMYNQRAIPVPA